MVACRSTNSMRFICLKGKCPAGLADINTCIYLFFYWESTWGSGWLGAQSWIFKTTNIQKGLIDMAGKWTQGKIKKWLLHSADMILCLARVILPFTLMTIDMASEWMLIIHILKEFLCNYRKHWWSSVISFPWCHKQLLYDCELELFFFP